MSHPRAPCGALVTSGVGPEAPAPAAPVAVRGDARAITGRVVDAGTGAPLRGASVWAGPSEIRTEADRAIATVVPPTVLEEAKPAEEVAAAEPELVKEKKEEGEEAEGPKEGGKEG